MPPSIYLNMETDLITETLYCLVIYNSGRCTKSRVPVIESDPFVLRCRKVTYLIRFEQTPWNILQQAFRTAYFRTLIFRWIFESEFEIIFKKQAPVPMWPRTSSIRVQILNPLHSVVRFEVTMKNGVFWDVTPCGSYKNQRFGGT
jgi:hypothetical protein